MSEKATCTKCGKEVGATKSENWDFMCGQCFSAALPDIINEIGKPRKQKNMSEKLIIKDIDVKDLLLGAATNLESPHPQQWSAQWANKLRIIADALPTPHVARTHDPYHDDAEPLVEALGAVCDLATDAYARGGDFRFAEIYNLANEATGGTQRFEIESD